MKKLNSAMTPEAFVKALRQWRQRWRRQAGGNGHRAGLRHARDLSRKHIRLFKAAHKLSELPQMAYALDEGDAWTEASSENAKVVFLADALDDSGESIPPDAAETRRHLRRLIRKNLDSTSSTTLDLVNARNAPNRRLPPIADAASAGRRGMRGIYLESLGATILPHLSEREVLALEKAGAIVLDNSLITLTDPFDETTVAGNPACWHLPVINTEAARKKELTGTGAIIGILDTGIDVSHPEFKGKEIDFRAFAPNGSPLRNTRPQDYQTHGTHVAAICAGINIGVAPKAELAVAAVMTERDDKGRMCGFTNQIIAGVNWLAGHAGSRGSGVDVINASLGGGNIDRKYYMTYRTHRLRGRLTVAAIGNDGTKGVGNHGAPGKFHCVLAVGASDAYHQVAPFSAWGPSYGQPPVNAFKPDLVAPGVDILSALPNARYGLKSGTSMACSMVSGAAALLIEQDASLRGNADMLVQRLLALTCVLPPGPHNADARSFGKGRLDLAMI